MHVHYAKRKELPQQFTGPVVQGGMEMTREDIQTHNHIADDRVYDLGGGRVALIVRPRKDKDGWGAHVFELAGGGGTFHWDEFTSDDEITAWLAKFRAGAR